MVCFSNWLGRFEFYVVFLALALEGCNGLSNVAFDLLPQIGRYKSAI